MKLFLELGESDVKRMYLKCEVFVGNLQVGEDDEMGSGLDDASR